MHARCHSIELRDSSCIVTTQIPREIPLHLVTNQNTLYSLLIFHELYASRIETVPQMSLVETATNPQILRQEDK